MRIYETGRVIIDCDGNRIELSPAETSIIGTLGTSENYHGKMAVIALLKQYGNADKVLEVLILRNQSLNGCYTLSPIITQIGESSAAQYVADVNEAVARFNAAQQEYVRRLHSAKTEKECAVVIQWWNAWWDNKDAVEQAQEASWMERDYCLQICQFSEWWTYYKSGQPRRLVRMGREELEYLAEHGVTAWRLIRLSDNVTLAQSKTYKVD